MPSTTTAEPDTRPLLDRARSAVPGYDDAKRAEQAVKARRAALPTEHGRTPGDVVADLVRTALDGGDLAALNVGERAVTAERTTRARNAEQDALGKAADSLIRERQERLADGIAAAITVVRDELDDVIDTARPVFAALDGVHDAQTAIERDVVPAWRQFGALAERYAAVRIAQTVLASATARAGDANATEDSTDRPARLLVDLYGYFADPSVVAPITEHHRAGRTRGPVVDNGVTISPPLPWLDPVPAAALAVALTPGAEPWVPDPDQLEAARLADITGEPLADNLDPEEEARRVKARAARTNNLRRQHGMTEGDRIHLDYER